MVKTRGLGHALGKVIARGLGRGDGDDFDGAPQRRRPTASACRQRVEAAVAGDELMVDVDAHDTGPETDAQDIGAQDAVDEPEGFPGEPRDPSVLTEYADHVAASVWSGQERPELKLSSHGRKVHNLGRPVPAIEDMVVGTELSLLIACSIDTDDRGLISSFIKRWHRETSSFHLPVGEVSIMLDNVASLLHLPIIGAFHDFQPLRTNEAVLLLVELLMVSAEVAMAETDQCGVAYVRLQWLRDLNDVSLSTSQQFAGYITLLQLRSAMLIRTTTRCEEGIYSDVQAAPGSSEDPRCLLDAICGASTCAGLSSDFVLLGTALLGACCYMRGLCASLAMSSAFLHSLSIHGCHMMTWTHYSDHLAAAGDLCYVRSVCA
ncbi:Protein MAIN-LIKE 1 [Glycine max]|nr:Protein MAIN-LIKE 1 [Glycine max]